jgi:hypothetical protein
VVISVEKENVFSVEKEHTKGLLRWYHLAFLVAFSFLSDIDSRKR